MKKLIYLILSVTTLLFASHIFADSDRIVIICPDDKTLSNDFENAPWSQGASAYYLVVDEPLPDVSQYIQGSLHTLGFNYPSDKYPDLTFERIKVNQVEERGIWGVDCMYGIYNTAFHDDDYGDLHMTTGVDLSYDYMPDQSSSYTAVFVRNTSHKK